MSLNGCNHGCIHKKDIKVEQMKNIYLFRCSAIKKYMTKNDVKLRCSLFQSNIIIKEHSVSDYLD